MKKHFRIFVLFSLIIFLVACSSTSRETVSTDDEEINEDRPSLYPAYIYEENEMRWGYINNKGEFVIKPQFSAAADFDTQRLAIIQKDSMYGVINESGKYIVQPVYQYIRGIDSGVIVAIKGDDGAHTIINIHGEEVVQINGYVDRFSQGLALFTDSVDWKNQRYGYIDTKGQVVIKPQYISGTPFKDGKALVKLDEKSFAVIDQKGNVLNTLYENIVGEISEDVVIYRNESTNKEGYMTLDGKKLTEAVFLEARPFINSYAQVMIYDEWKNYMWGLINKNGEFVVEPKYRGIKLVDEGIYAVNNLVDDELGWMSLDYIPMAIMNKEGELLSDFVYYKIGKLVDNMYYLSDGVYTYIVDDQYMPISTFPKLYGFGEINILSGLIKVELDHELLYFTKEGKEIWKSEYSYPLKNGASVVAQKHRPNRYMLTYHPQIINHPDKGVEKQINKDLEKLFVDIEKDSEALEEFYYVTIDKYFEIKELDEIITVLEYGYFYPIGAAHGSPWITSHHININTGRFYTLEDLFTKNSNYQDILETIIKAQMEQQNENKFMYFDLAEPTIQADQSFVLTEDGIEIFFQVYEIASYAAGMPSFEIPYEELRDIIDFQGDMWRSIEKVVKY